MCQAQCTYIHFVHKHAVQSNTVYFHCGDLYKEKCCTKFIMQFPGTSVPSKSTVNEMTNKFAIMDSMLNEK